MTSEVKLEPDDPAIEHIQRAARLLKKQPDTASNLNGFIQYWGLDAYEPDDTTRSNVRNIVKAFMILSQEPDRAAILAMDRRAEVVDEDDIADAISDSIDMDWTARDGAKAVMRLLRGVSPPAEPAAWRPISTAPEDTHVILATKGGHVGEALMLIDEDTGQQKWTWPGAPVHPAHTPLGWMPMPPPIDKLVEA